MSSLTRSSAAAARMPCQRLSALTLHHHRGQHRDERDLVEVDGSLVYTLQNVVVVRDADGKIIQYRGLMLDITELKSFQSELQRQRDFNAKILENTQSLILVVRHRRARQLRQPARLRSGSLPGRAVGWLSYKRNWWPPSIRRNSTSPS